jgi:hypothetical protein
MPRLWENWWRTMSHDVFDREIRCDFLDVVSRMFIGSFGMVWFAVGLLNIELGMRELSFQFESGSISLTAWQVYCWWC